MIRALRDVVDRAVLVAAVIVAEQANRVQAAIITRRAGGAS